MKQIEVSRRDFLKGSSAAATTAVGGLSAGSALTRPAGANERIRIGVIGCGNQGRRWHIERFPKDANVEIVSVCDPDEARRAQGCSLGDGAKPVEDLRRILDDSSIDAVTIAAPDHWHTPAAILAMEAGKHVYVEKPCSHNLREGQLLVEVARRSGKVVQHGTQARSNQGFKEAIQMLHDGTIGEVLIAKAWNIQKRKNIGHEQPSKPPDGFDYDIWVGPAPMIPFQKNRHHYSWHWWYNFGTGDLGNDGVHEFDLARWGLGQDTHPTNVAVAGGKFYFDDDQEFPDTVTATFDYPGNGQLGSRRQLIFEMRLWSGNQPYGLDSGVEFSGTKGKMLLGRRGKFQIWDGENKKLATQPSQAPKMFVPDSFRAWLAAIRGHAAATANAETAHRSTSLCHLANIAVRVGRSFQFDPEREEIIGDNEASLLLTRAYRESHWAVPKGV